MEPYTLDRNFKEQEVIDEFFSLIWTERYYGDSEVEMVVPATTEMIQRLSVGTFLSNSDVDEVMIIENVNIEQGKLKVTGISLLPWLNNRFVRTSPNHEDKYWYVSPPGTPGWTLWAIIYHMCCEGSPFMTGAWNMGIPSPGDLVIPGLWAKSIDDTGAVISVGVPYGPLYDAMKEIATTYAIGMTITLEPSPQGIPVSTPYYLGFRTYKGLDRTSRQTANSIVRFSPLMDSFTDIKELQSIAKLKTRAYAFAPQNPDGLATTPGISMLTGAGYTGFDLRALLVFAEDITTDMVGGDAATLLNILNSRALDGLIKNPFVATVDGEIVPTSQFQYGVHYGLGDLIEVQGNSNIVQICRVTEYIRSQDDNGEKAYPTVTALT